MVKHPVHLLNIVRSFTHLIAENHPQVVRICMAFPEARNLVKAVRHKHRHINGSVTIEYQQLIRALNARIPELVHAADQFSLHSDLRRAAARHTAARAGMRLRGAARLPSMAKMAKTLAGAVMSEGRARLHGDPPLALDQVEARMAICRACDRLIGQGTSARCGQCGCFIAPKSRFRTQNCPLGKWFKV
jgi:hypothetical protein